MQTANEIASRLLGRSYERLDERTQRVARHLAERKHISRNLSEEVVTVTTFGQRAADRVALFGGSWSFVGLFAFVMLLWVGLNIFLLAVRGRTFDPYPYILLNLILSTLAAIQAPIILMSQNRQSEKDRIHAEHDYEVNLKAELEIMLLHEKVDHLREGPWEELVEMQREQHRLLTNLVRAGVMAPVDELLA